MRSGRLGLSAIDKRDVGADGRPGRRCLKSVASTVSAHNTIRAALPVAAFLLLLVAARGWHSHLLNERIFCEGRPAVYLWREIARHLGRAVSTVSRGIARHGGRPAYRAYDADQQAFDSLRIELAHFCCQIEARNDTDWGIALRSQGLMAEAFSRGLQITHGLLYGEKEEN